MAVFHVVIDDTSASEEVISRLKKHYPDNYTYHGRKGLIFVRTDDISEIVAANIGIKGEDQIEDASGAVFKMTSYYAGYTNGGIWEWLTKDTHAAYT